jgi:hypothetical protein
VPPLAKAVALPVEFPLQSTLTDVGIATFKTDGCVISIEFVAVHPLASVAVTI